MKKILIVDDEQAMRIGLKDNLEVEGYETDEAQDGLEAIEKIKANRYSLIILDVMMPGLSGFDVCKKIRAMSNSTPIILLTAKGEEIDKVLGLELGADDYITKPFSLRELLARVKVILRRTENSITPSNDIIVGKLKVNFSSFTATSNSEEINLSHREFEILKYIVDHKNETVSRDDLLENVWGLQKGITTRTIDNFIMKLRQKIEANANHPKIILTIYGIGYKLIM